MANATIWFMNARAKRFLESTAIKGAQILDRSGWLDTLRPGDIVAVKTHMGEAYNVGYLRPVIVRTLVDIEHQVYGGVENGLGTADYAIEEVPLDRDQAAISRFYPEVRAKKLKGMYGKHHPLSEIDTASFGQPTEGVKNPKHPKK